MRGPAVLRGALGEEAGDSWGGGEGLGTCGGKLEDSWNHLEAGAGAPGNPAGGLLLQVREQSWESLDLVGGHYEGLMGGFRRAAGFRVGGLGAAGRIRWPS